MIFVALTLWSYIYIGHYFFFSNWTLFNNIPPKLVKGFHKTTCSYHFTLKLLFSYLQCVCDFIVKLECRQTNNTHYENKEIIHGLIFYVQEIWHQKRNPSFMYTWHYLTQDRLGKDSLFLSIYFVFCNWYVF